MSKKERQFRGYAVYKLQLIDKIIFILLNT